MRIETGKNFCPQWDELFWPKDHSIGLSTNASACSSNFHHWPCLPHLWRCLSGLSIAESYRMVLVLTWLVSSSSRDSSLAMGAEQSWPWPSSPPAPLLWSELESEEETPGNSLLASLGALLCAVAALLVEVTCSNIVMMLLMSVFSLSSRVLSCLKNICDKNIWDFVQVTLT